MAAVEGRGEGRGGRGEVEYEKHARGFFFL